MTEGICDINHKQNIISYCKECEIMICESCLLNHHYTHVNKVQLLKSILLERISEYQNSLEKIELKMKVLERHANLVSVDENMSILHQKIESAYDTLIKAILKHKEELLKKATEGELFQQIHKHKQKYTNWSDFANKLMLVFRNLINKLKEAEEDPNKYLSHLDYTKKYHKAVNEKLNKFINHKEIDQFLKEPKKDFYVMLNLDLLNLDKIVFLSTNDAPLEIKKVFRSRSVTPSKSQTHQKYMPIIYPG
jgi:hypothetical protein